MHGGGESGAQQHYTLQIERLDDVRCAARDQPKPEQQAAEPDRHVDHEQPAPRRDLEHKRAHDGPECGGEAHGDAQHTHDLPEPLGAGCPPDKPLASWDEQPGGQALDDA